MPTINTTIKIQDQMSRQFAVMNNAVMTMVESFAQLDDEMTKDFQVAALHNVQREMESIAAQTNSAISEIAAAEGAQDNFNHSIGQGGNAAAGLLEHFKAIAATVGAGLGVKKMVELSDTVVSNMARLDLMNDGLQSTQELLDMSYQAAQNARGGYDAMTASVGQLGMNARDAFANSAEIVGFSELLSKQLAIAGANGQATESVMYNLTQALSMGVLRGQDLNAVLSNAPNIVQAIADYMGVSMGEIREMAQAGEITAQVVKEAMFAAADEINAKFESMPMTFGQMWQEMKNYAVKALEPMLLRMNDLFNSAAFQQFVSVMLEGVDKMAWALSGLLEIIVSVTNFIADHWTVIGPIVMGVVGAMVAWEVATTAVSLANAVLNGILAANPLMLVAMAIGIVIAAIWQWVASVGGITNAWMIAKDYIMTAMGQIALWSLQTVFSALEAWERFKIGIFKVAVGVANGLEHMKATGLMIVQDFVNGAIDLINQLIAAVNKIPGVSIDAIQKVTFGTQAKVQAEANRQLRAGQVAQKEAGLLETQALHQKQLKDLGRQFESQHQLRLNDINARISAQKADSIGGGASADWGNNWNMLGGNMGDALGGIGENTGSTAGNTGKMADAVEDMHGNLDLLRELAEMEVTNTFTTAEIHVDMTNHNTIHETQDIDGITTRLSDSLREELGLVAEGAHY